MPDALADAHDDPARRPKRPPGSPGAGPLALFHLTGHAYLGAIRAATPTYALPTISALAATDPAPPGGAVPDRRKLVAHVLSAQVAQLQTEPDVLPHRDARA